MDSKKKWTGANCCIVGCHTNKARCRGVAFISIPKAGASEDQDKWRAALISAINRCDEGFNPNKAKICSRHFEEGSVRYGPSGKCRGLFPWSLPTQWMPSKSQETPQNTRQEFTEQELPQLPECVLYENFEDVKKELENIQAPWIIKVNTPATVQIGISPETEYVWKIIVELRAESNTQAYVKVLGVLAPHLTADLKSKRLTTFLQELQMMSICAGVTDSSLQEYAAPPDGQQQFYRHIQYTTVNNVVCHISSVRSVQCWLLLSSHCSTYCMACHQVEHELLEKKNHQQLRMLQPLKPNDPLHCLGIDQLKTLFKNERKEKIRLEKQLQLMGFKENLNEHSVTMSTGMHNSLSAVDMSELESE